MEDIEAKQYENVCNRILPGLQMFVRDTFLAKETEEKYVIGKIIKEPTFCDVSCRVGGIITTHRYAILSNRFVDFSAFEQGTNWGLFVCKRNSFFKVLDIYKVNGKTQISLLHLDENWKLFENNHSYVEEDIVKMCRERFQKKYNTPPIPELATKAWLERLLYPIGINPKNEYISLHEETIDNKHFEITELTKTINSAKDETYKEIEKRKFLKSLPYIKAWSKDQKFISNLIEKKFLNKKEQEELIEFFDVTNKHWSKWNGESSFEIWLLFTNPEVCSVFNEKLINKARVKIIPHMSKISVGNIEKEIINYAKNNQEFRKLYEKRISKKNYFKRNYIYKNPFEKVIEAIRVLLYRNKKIRDYLNRHRTKYFCAIFFMGNL